MQAIVGLSRGLSRAFVNGVVSRSQNTAETSASSDAEQKLVTAVSGFSKPGSNYNIDNILRGQIGDDAYFIARHVDEWSQSDFHVTSSYRRQEPEPELVPSSSSSFSSRATSEPSGASVPGPIDGVRAPVSTDDRKGSADVIGVADGVGGWRAYGVDPGLFSNHLMRNCERLVKAGFFISNSPKALLEQGFREMQESKAQIIGSSTACLMMLSHSDLKLYTTNIGDSGFLVVRRGEVVHRSQEQQHYFNTPFQLSLPPTELQSQVLADRPESADQYEFSVEDGDVILLATDGLFDNVPDRLLVAEMAVVQHCKDEVRLQQCANTIALMARKLSKDPKFLSPFAVNALAAGIETEGGKPDDITVLLATVSL